MRRLRDDMTIEPFPYQRIFLAGGPGSGKTTLARALSSRLGLIHYELDRVVYSDGSGTSAAPASLSAFATQLAAEDAWLAEGDYAAWVEPLLERADWICLLDVPPLRGIWQCLRRELIDRSSWRPRIPFWNFMRRCATYYVIPGSVMHDDRPTERSIGLVNSTRFAHKIRRYRSAGAVRFEPPPAAVRAARRSQLALVESATAFLRGHGHEGNLWLWYDAAEPHRGVYMPIAVANGWKDRLIGTDFPDRTNVVTGRRHPLPVGEPLAIMTSRAPALDTAMRRTASYGVRLTPIARRTIGGDGHSFDVIIVTPVPTADALVCPVPLHEMRVRHGAVHRRGSGIRVLTPPARWHYAAEIDVASAIPCDRADAIGYVRVRGSLEAGPVGIGVLARDAQTFLARRALSASRQAVDVYVPVARVGDAATVVIQTWSQPCRGALTITAMDIVCEREAPRE